MNVFSGPQHHASTTAEDGSAEAPAPLVAARGVSRHYGRAVALDDVSLAVLPATVHVLLGPAGAGKSTLIRILAGITRPSAGTVATHGRVGLVPASDRSFYERISGLENLAFFARLTGMRRRDAVARAGSVLRAVALDPADDRAVGRWSPGSRKRLAVARALLAEPDVLLIDDAARDLDVEAAQRMRLLVSYLAARGTGVLWVTESLHEIRGFGEHVTFLAGGAVCFDGSVAELDALGGTGRYVLRLRGTTPLGPVGRARLQRAVGGRAIVTLPRDDDPEHVVLEPRGRPVAEAIAALAQAGFAVLASRQERSEVEEAFLRLTAVASA